MRASAILVCLALGCGDGDPEAGSGDTSSGTSGEETGGGTASGPSGAGTSSASGNEPTESSESSSGSDEGDTPPPEGVLAAGISVDAVEVNQGVGITIATAGALAATEDRIAPVIGGRAALIRASYTLAADFDPRPVVGRLWLRNGDDDSVYTEERMVTGAPDWTSIDGTFHWVVEPDDLTGMTEFRIQFLELAEEGEPAGDVTGSQLPADGFAPLDAWGERMVVDLVVVPFTCDGVSDLVLDPEDLADFEAYLFNTYAVQELNMTVHDPVHSSSCSEFDAAEYDLPALREAEGADPWVYYGGLMAGSGGGYSISIDGGDQMDYRRTFANHAWRDYGLTFDLFAHELAHNHGRMHSFEDASFPDDNGGSCGAISTHGWGPRSALMPSSGYGNDLDLGLEWFDPHAQLLAPTDDNCGGLPDGNRWNFNDMTSYQYPYWVSPYTYAAGAERIRLISSWENADAPGPGRTLRLVLGPEGDIHRSEHAGARAVQHADAWASCGERLFPVRSGRAVHDVPDAGGRLRSYPYETFELPLTEAIDPTTCVLGPPESIAFTAPPG